MSTDYAAVLTYRYPGTLWSLDGDDYKGLDWQDEETAKPTKAQLDKQWPEVKAQIELEQRNAAMRAAYAQYSDPVFFQWQRGEKTEAEWRAAVAAVQAQFAG